MRQAPMQRQANRLASQGRYGDSMMVHMNPTEVDVLNQMSPGGLTRNPQTGQPEAFAIIGSLLASLLTKAGAAAGASAAASGAAMPALAKLGTALSLGTGSPAVAGALASGATTTAQTGSLEEGIKTGLMSFVGGKVAGSLAEGLGGQGGLLGGAGQEAAKAAPVVGEIAPVGGTLADVAGSGASMEAGAGFVPNIVADAATSLPAGATLSHGGINPLMAAPDTIAQQAGSGFGGIGDAIGDIGMGDLAVPMLQGAMAEDAIAARANALGPPEDEEEDDFYQEVRPGDRGLQFPEFGYDAGASGEFDYFQNPFKVIPVAKNGGLLRRFEEGGKVDEPINLGGIRGFNQTSAPSFNFSGSNMYGPAPINQADFNLSSTPVDYSQANVASQVPVRSPFAGIGSFNFGSGGQREFGPSDADIYSFLSGTALPTNAGFQGSESIPDYAGTVETPALEDMQSYFAEQQMSSAPGRFGGEDLARAPLEQQVLSNYVPQTTYAAPMNRGPENVAANTGNWFGGDGGWDFSGTGTRPAGDYESGFTSSYTPAAQDSIYSPQTAGMRVPGFGMSPNFRMMG